MAKTKVKQGEIIKLIIDGDTLVKYNKYYFAKYPRRRVAPILIPTHPSINKWFIMKRPAMNHLKEQWKIFIMWVIENEGLSGLKIQSCTMEFVSFFRTRIRVDCDNTTPKFILDGFVLSGLIVDDDYLHLQSLTLRCAYDKLRPRTEILIHIL